MTIERTGPTGSKGKAGNNISCPLCSHSVVHYRKETDTYVCGHCDYRWYTIEHCNI